jgi:hypothetical protein
MIDPVQQAKQRALAALKSWDRARASVNNPDTLPARLDDIVRVTREVVGTVRQDIVIDLDAIMVELATIEFPDADDEGLSSLERETLALQGGLDRLRRTASRVGFAEAEEDLGLPPGLRVPSVQLSEQLERFTAAIEAVRPALQTLAERNAAEPQSNPVQTALIQNQTEQMSVKVDLALLKTSKISFVDVSGLASIAKSLQRSFDQFLATVRSSAIAVSQWVREEAPRLLTPVKERIVSAAARLVQRAAAWIKGRTYNPISESDDSKNATRQAERDRLADLVFELSFRRINITLSSGRESGFFSI